MDRLSDNVLAEAEDFLRSGGFDYPLAWALGFLVDNQGVLCEGILVTSHGDFDLLNEYEGLCVEIVHGFDKDEEGDEFDGILECPQCHEHDTETQIKDHGVCHECMRRNYEQEPEEL